MNFALLSQIKQKHITFAFFSIYLLIGLFVFSHYGLGWDDECSRLDTGYINLNYILNHDAKPLLDGNEKYHGPFLEIILVAIEKLFHMSDTRHIYLMRHFMMFSIFYLSVIAFFTSAKKFFGSTWALIACIFLILSPRIFADSFFNTKDMGLLAMFNFSLFSYFSFFDTKNFKWSVIHGLFTGFLISVRILGILIPVITVAYCIIWFIMYKNERSKIVWLFVYLSVAILTTIATWPVLWEGPIVHIAKAFEEMKNYHWNASIVYPGGDVTGTTVPWHYLPLWILISTPMLYSLFFFIGIFYYCKNSIQGGFKAFFANYQLNSIVALCIGPVLAIILFHSVVYDAWRHVFFIYPFFILVVIYGIKGLLQQLKLMYWFKPLLITIFSLQSIYLLFWMIKNHPHQNVYFNSIAKIIFQPLENNFERDYWGLCYKQGFDYLLKHQSGKMVVSVCNAPGTLNLLALSPEEKNRIEIHNNDFENYDYYITNYRGNCKPLEKPIYLIKVDDIPILGIYPRKH